MEFVEGIEFAGKKGGWLTGKLWGMKEGGTGLETKRTADEGVPHR